MVFTSEPEIFGNRGYFVRIFHYSTFKPLLTSANWLNKINMQKRQEMKNFKENYHVKHAAEFFEYAAF